MCVQVPYADLYFILCKSLQDCDTQCIKCIRTMHGTFTMCSFCDANAGRGIPYVGITLGTT